MSWHVLRFFFVPLHHEKNKLQKSIVMEYMSQEGYDKLVAELRHMESVELPQVREAIAEARDKSILLPCHHVSRQRHLLSLTSLSVNIIAFSHIVIKLSYEGGSYAGALLIDRVEHGICHILYTLYCSVCQS